MKDNIKQDTLYSKEGCTQGDPSAMAFYAAGTKPLIDELEECTDQEKCKQSWYADDSNAAGFLSEVKIWWQRLNDMGPKYGYFPKASKCVLILKDESLVTQANALFSGTGITITCRGERHLGAVVGQESFKNEYVDQKIKKWIQDIKDLAYVANDEPQAAMSAYVKSICHRWVFLQRTVPGIRDNFIPLEECIRHTLIPALIGRQVSDVERQIISLPVRLGGLGIADPTETAEREYEASVKITEDLANLIFLQKQDLSLYNRQATAEKVKTLKAAKERYLSEKFEGIISTIEDASLVRCLMLNREKGAGAWLTALPLKDHGYSLNCGVIYQILLNIPN